MYAPTNEIPVISEMPLVDFPDLDFYNINFISTTIFTQSDSYYVYTGSILGDGTATTFKPIQEWFEYIP